VTRQAWILRRRPQTRRERMVARIETVRDGAGRTIRRISLRPRPRTATEQARELFAQLGHAVQREPQATPKPRLARLHVRQTKS
jgi:hypothetical protein